MTKFKEVSSKIISELIKDFKIRRPDDIVTQTYQRLDKLISYHNYQQDHK